jgi:hypothetical protein
MDMLVIARFITVKRRLKKIGLKLKSWNLNGQPNDPRGLQMDITERIAKYLACTPPAIAGQGGHNQTFFVACQLYNGFALSEQETLYWLQQYNVRCNPVWSDKEIAHKAKQAGNASHNKPRGHLLGDSPVKREEYRPTSTIEAVKIDPSSAIENHLQGFRCTEAELSDASPVKMSEDWRKDGVVLLENCFEPTEYINIVTKYQRYERKTDSVVKANPDGIGESKTCQDMVEYVQNGFTSLEGGAWLRINPVDGKGVSDANVASFRHALIEFDRVPMDLQLSFLAKAPLPIAAILTSGGKSCHAWIRIDAADFAEYESTVMRLREVLTKFGIDRSNKNPSRLSRLPGVVRKIGGEGDGIQRLLYCNRNPQQKPIIQMEDVPCP